MSVPLQLSAPEGAHIHIHLSTEAEFIRARGQSDSFPSQPVESRMRTPLIVAVSALLTFGFGYMVRGGVNAMEAFAQAPQPAGLGLAQPPGYSDPQVAAALGNAPGLPPSIHVNPLPVPYQRLPQQVQVPGQPALYPPQPLRPAPGMVVRAPFPVAPDTPQANGPTGPSLPGTPAAPRNPFGLD